MADVKLCFAYTLHFEDATLEGKVVPDPSKKDAAAVSRFGINSASHPEAVRDGFYEMSRDAALQYAEDVFKFDYFNLCGAYNIEDQDIADKFCDLAFNEGTHEASKLVQQALGFTGKQVDGLAGARTIAAINAADSALLMASIKNQAKAFYLALAATDAVFRPNLEAVLTRVES
jgi:lysozyme family protein